MNKDLQELENKIEYKFKNIDYLVEALTHSSYANESKVKISCNERMEFLGDAVLSIVSAEYLYTKYPDMTEGDLTKLRSSLVCTQSLSNFAREVDLGEYLYLGKGEKATGGDDRDAILEDAFESVIAAIYLDGGMEPAKKHILRFLDEGIENHENGFKDYKTYLQEIVQQNPDERLNYVLVGASGPDHNKKFEAEVHLNSNVIGRGVGQSKKKAEQEAAKEALLLMGLR